MKAKFSMIGLALLAAGISGMGAPSITVQPANQPVTLGANGTFQVTASGIAPLGYQWQLNAAAMQDATNAILNLANVQLTNTGNYTVVVTDSSGTLTSRVARLDIIPTFTKTTLNGLASDSAGAAWLDYNGDGDLDLLVANGPSSAGARNSLYRNNGDGTFTQIMTGPIATDVAPFISVAWGDYDNDGWPDILAGTFPEALGGKANFLFHNNANSSFDEITTGNLVTTTGSFMGIWGDYDNDGFLDVFLTSSGGTNLLFRGNGDGTFTQVGGTAMSFRYAQGANVANGAAWGDFDNDGFLDLFLFGGSGHNLLFHNNRDGTFTQIRQAPFTTDVGPSTGAAWGDYDNDGFLDLFVVNGNFDTAQHHNFLYHNNGDGTFTKVTTGNIVTDGGSFVTAAWEDFDNDGNLDLFVTRAISGANTKNALYHNNGDGTFTPVTASSLVADAGGFAGCAWGDYDNDGFPDLFVSAGQPSLLFHNGGNSHSWITFKLIGTVSNRSAMGAKIRLQATIGGKTYWQMRAVSNGDALAGNSLFPHFGLGDATNIVTVRIEWPSGTVQELRNLSARQFLTVTEPPQLAAGISNGGPQFSLKGGRSFQYDIEASEDLVTWTSIGAVTVHSPDGKASLVDTNAVNWGRRFYRAVSR